MALETADIKDAKRSPEPLPDQPGGLSGRLYLPSDYDELRLFAMLKWRFGGPNGPLSLFVSPGGDPDAPFKWDFLFVPCENLKLQIIRSVNGIELAWWGENPAGASILQYLERNLQKYSSEVNEEINKLESYRLILNPFLRHRSIAQHALQELESINLQEPSAPPSVGVRKEDIQAYIERFEGYMNLVQKQASLTMLLVMEAAFMAEAYLNLILASLLRDEIRRSPKILNETLTRKWKSKIERLPVDCKFIKGQPDLGDSRIRDATIMFDLRNQLAHSYPDKDDLKLGEMWFYQSFPVLPKAAPFHKFALALGNQLPSVDQAKSSLRSSERLIEYLAELIDDRIIKEFKIFVEANPLGFNQTKQMYGVPFGNALIFFAGFG